MTHAAARLMMRETVELHLWRDAMSRFDAELQPDLSNAPELLVNVPLAAFAATLLNPALHYPRASKFLPVMPSDQVQCEWTGSAGTVLLETSISFMSHLCAVAGGPSGLRGKRVLDFGIGWGRLARLFIKYIPPSQLSGCDAWESSLSHARDCRLQNKLVHSDAFLGQLPFEPQSFDLIYAFSVFTHLSERAFVGCLRGVHDMLAIGGDLVFTVRPRDYWSLRPSLPPELLTSESFAFVPSSGLDDFGDTTITNGWLNGALRNAGLKLSGMEWSPVDSLQVVVIATRV